jgi:hypothetical protein
MKRPMNMMNAMPINRTAHQYSYKQKSETIAVNKMTITQLWAALQYVALKTLSSTDQTG